MTGIELVAPAPASHSGPAPDIIPSVDSLINQPTGSRADFEERVLELTNQYRIDNGLSPLTLNVLLDQAANNHSQNMAEQDFYDHTDLGGNGVGNRVSQIGYQFSWVGENIAAGYLTPEDVVQGWIDSPGHRANLLNPNFEEIGVGYYYLENDPGNETWRHYWTQVFGASSTSAAL